MQNPAIESPATEATLQSTSARGLSPESITRYVLGPPEESHQFDFFIGSWDLGATLYPEAGAAPIELGGLWEARWLHDRRLLVDDVALRLPGGKEVMSMVNVRTYCPEIGCWEIVGQRALEATPPVRTVGHFREGEMHLSFETPDPRGPRANRVRFHEIREDSWRWQWDHRPADAAEDAEWAPFAKIRATRSRPVA